MKAQFDQQLVSSFYLWLESELLDSSVAAYNSSIACDFKYFDYPDLASGLIGYAAEYRSLVADTGITSPMTGVSINGTGVSLDPDTNGGIYMDYKNGRLIVPSDSGESLTITGEVAVKEVNTYLSNDNDLELILHSDFLDAAETEPYFYQKEEDLDKNVYFIPACFISLASSNNKEFCFGGEEETRNRVRVLVIAKEDFVVSTICSKFRDSARKYITHLNYEDFPYGYAFTLKSYPYNYESYINSNGTAIASFIEKVSVAKMDSEQIRKKLNKHYSIAFIDFDLLTRRFPRL